MKEINDQRQALKQQMASIEEVDEDLKAQHAQIEEERVRFLSFVPLLVRLINLFFLSAPSLAGRTQERARCDAEAAEYLVQGEDKASSVPSCPPPNLLHP
jgi:hypothetical protein